MIAEPDPPVGTPDSDPPLTVLAGLSALLGVFLVIGGGLFIFVALHEPDGLLLSLYGLGPLAGGLLLLTRSIMCTLGLLIAGPGAFWLVFALGAFMAGDVSWGVIHLGIAMGLLAIGDGLCRIGARRPWTRE